MGKLLFFLAFFGWLNFPSENTDPKAFLSGNEKKSWYMFSKRSGSSAIGCRASESVTSDNTYTFFSDGKFEFDHGNVTEDPSCEGCCSDFVNAAGVWKFTSNNKKLKVTILHEQENKANAKNIVLFDAKIEYLDEETLKFTQTDKSGIQYFFEFRRK